MARVISFSSHTCIPNGILDHGNLDKIWPASITDSVTGKTRVLAPDPTVRQLLLELVHRFGLALRLEKKDGSLQTRSLVPAMLKADKNPLYHDVKWREVTATHQVVGMSLKLDFVPHNLVPQVLLRAYRYASSRDSAVGGLVVGCVVDCMFSLYM